MRFKLVASVLPLEARNALVRASQVDAKNGPGESKERALELSHVIQKLRAQYPTYFRNGTQK